ncbi:hypothetical protein KJ567_04030 [Candidatus Bipolaricaulota bacterium]|nr:hypothetical protein [Candidatus Bipolaricaulota bacterium]
MIANPSADALDHPGRHRLERRKDLTRLTIETIDDLLDLVLERKAGSIDLRNARFVDPYALLLLDLLMLELRDRGRRVDLVRPASPVVNRWMGAMGFPSAKPAGGAEAPSTRDPASALQPIASIDDESHVGRIVDGFEQRLADRHPLSDDGRRSLIAIMIELFQNVPHHSNADGSVEDPHGIAAMQDYEDSIFLAIADRGIGLRGSLGLRDGYEGITSSQALRAILDQGVSRFDDPGRGGELQRIARIVRSWDGTFAVRSGDALLYFDDKGADVYDVPEFPGVQFGLRLPRHIFGIGMLES